MVPPFAFANQVIKIIALELTWRKGQLPCVDEKPLLMSLTCVVAAVTVERLHITDRNDDRGHLRHAHCG
jgi:hypothetical protein